MTRLVGGADLPVLLGLAGAVLLTVLDPLAHLPGMSAVPAASRALVPGLAVVLVVFVFDRWRRRTALHALHAEVDASAREAQARALDVDRLLAFHHALGRAVDPAGITAALHDHLAPIAGTAGVSVLVSQPCGWAVFAGDSTGADELLARVSGAADTAAAAAAREVELPLRAGGQALGLLVVRRAPGDVDAGTLRTLEAAAAMVAVAVKHVQAARQLQETGLRDALTGCLSRAHGLEIIDGELRRARRSQLPVSLVLIDVDHLKSINTRYGYLCGDAVLAMVGRRLRDVLRRSDVKCRYDGEEFVVLLPETALVGARRVAETLRREIAHRPVPWNGDAIPATASFGVTQVLPAEVNGEAVIARAQAAARRAQDEGHNTVRVASVV